MSLLDTLDIALCSYYFILGIIMIKMFYKSNLLLSSITVYNSINS